MMRVMCGVQLKERKRANNLMLVMVLNETVDQLDGKGCALVWSGAEKGG